MTNSTLMSIETESDAFDEMTVDIINACLDAKGRDIVILDMKGVSDLADKFVIVSGRSDRQVQGISNRIYDSLLEKRSKPSSVDGLENGQWVILDYGDILVHVFYEAARDLYDLEGFWKKASRTLVKESMEDYDRKGQAA